MSPAALFVFHLSRCIIDVAQRKRAIAALVMLRLFNTKHRSFVLVERSIMIVNNMQLGGLIIITKLILPKWNEMKKRARKVSNFYCQQQTQSKSHLDMLSRGRWKIRCDTLWQFNNEISRYVFCFPSTCAIDFVSFFF